MRRRRPPDDSGSRAHRGDGSSSSLPKTAIFWVGIERDDGNDKIPVSSVLDR